MEIGDLLTTAMAVMPHIDVGRALETAVSLDVPFWPQLPLLNYYEDMYVQAAEHFPGIILDLENRKLQFPAEKFALEAEEMLSHFGDAVRPFMLEFMARRAKVQLSRLKGINYNAFMFIDEPGLQFVFSGISGYGDVAAKRDLETFFEMIERPRGVHLCGNPDWDSLLGLDLDLVSVDTYTNGEVFCSYAGSIRKFLDQGGTLVWGIVPTNFEQFEHEQSESLEKRLKEIWGILANSGIDLENLLSRSMLSPATCCLVNPDDEHTVEKAFKTVKSLSEKLRSRYRLA